MRLDALNYVNIAIVNANYSSIQLKREINIHVKTWDIKWEYLLEEVFWMKIKRKYRQFTCDIIGDNTEILINDTKFKWSEILAT
jgi:hypothetical protein